MRRMSSSMAEQPTAQPRASADSSGLSDTAVASLTAALQQYESASAEARADTNNAMDRQLELAKARFSGDGASTRWDAASAAEPGSAAEHGAEAGGHGVQQGLLDQRQGMDAVLGEPCRFPARRRVAVSLSHCCTDSGRTQRQR